MKKSKCGPVSKFSTEEDTLLIQLVNSLPEDSWQEISTHFSGKTPKQCRNRWCNYVNPILKHGDWDTYEELVILQKYEEYGPKWAAISACLPNRSPNDIRYHWIQLTGGDSDQNISKLVEVSEKHPQMQKKDEEKLTANAKEELPDLKDIDSILQFDIEWI